MHENGSFDDKYCLAYGDAVVRCDDRQEKIFHASMTIIDDTDVEIYFNAADFPFVMPYDDAAGAYCLGGFELQSGEKMYILAMSIGGPDGYFIFWRYPEGSAPILTEANSNMAIIPSDSVDDREIAAWLASIHRYILIMTDLIMTDPTDQFMN